MPTSTILDSRMIYSLSFAAFRNGLLWHDVKVLSGVGSSILWCGMSIHRPGGLSRIDFPQHRIFGPVYLWLGGNGPYDVGWVNSQMPLTREQLLQWPGSLEYAVWEGDPAAGGRLLAHIYYDTTELLGVDKGPVEIQQDVVKGIEQVAGNVGQGILTTSELAKYAPFIALGLAGLYLVTRK